MLNSLLCEDVQFLILLLQIIKLGGQIDHQQSLDLLRQESPLDISRFVCWSYMNDLIDVNKEEVDDRTFNNNHGCILVPAAF